MASSIDFLQEEINAVSAQVATAKEISAQADTIAVDTAKQNQINDDIKASSLDGIATQEALVENASSLAGLAGEMDSAILQMQQGVQKASGLAVTTAQAAEQYNAPARQNYLDEAANPVNDANIKRYSNEVDLYSTKLAQLNADTSFSGMLKRSFKAPAMERNLAKSRQNLAAAQGRKINATNTLNASLQGNMAFANSSTAVERAMIADSITRAESSFKILQSNATVVEADRNVLANQLQLDNMRTDMYIKEYSLLKERGLATTANMAALQTKLHAEQSLEAAAKRGKSIEEREGVQAEWRAFITDSFTDSGEASQLQRMFPDAFDPTVLNSKVGQTFWKSRGVTGTSNEFGEKALTKRKLSQPLDDKDAVALAMIDEGVRNQRVAVNAQYDALIKDNPREVERLNKERKDALSALQDPAVMAEYYTKGMAAMENNASTGITSGAILVPDWNKKLADPEFPYSSNISEQFKGIMQSDEWVAIDMGMSPGQDPRAQLQGTVAGIGDYIFTVAETDYLANGGTAGKQVVLSDATNKIIDIVAQGAADYYKSVRQMNNQSNAGVGSDILPAIIIPEVGVGGSSVNLENAVHWEQIIRKQFQATNLQRKGRDLFTPSARESLRGVSR